MISESFERALADARDLLQAGGFPFAVIGGLCVLVRGEARFTQDIDVVIAAEPQDALILLSHLDESGFQPVLEEDAAEFLMRAYMLPLRHGQTGLTVDIAIGAMGFERQLIQRAEEIRLGSLLLPVATAEDLILMKLIAGRPRDVEDVEGIVLAQLELDWDYLLAVGAGLQSALSQDLVPAIERLRDQA